MPTPPSEPDTDEQEIQRLQQVIRGHRAALDAAETGTPAYQSGLVAVLEATVQLVNHETGIPGRRREIYSARTTVIVRRVGLVTAPIIGVIAVVTLTPWLLSMWWLLLLVPLLAIAVLITATASGAAPSDRPTRRRAAASWVTAILIDLTLVIGSPWLPHWLTAVLMVVGTLGGLFAAGELLINTDPAKPSETES